MKKIILLAFFTISIVACKENKNSLNKSKSEITFNELDLIKSKPQFKKEEFLEKKNYILLESSFANQWKSKSTDDIIQFNDKGVLVFLTYNVKTYDKLVIDLKKTIYENTGKTIKNEVEVESYIKEDETVFLSSIEDPNNGKTAYSITFLTIKK
jgi:hypothetical protein